MIKGVNYWHPFPVSEVSLEHRENPNYNSKDIIFIKKKLFLLVKNSLVKQKTNIDEKILFFKYHPDFHGNYKLCPTC